jgi:peptide/nickel transport system substrate-binding protein
MRSSLATGARPRLATRLRVLLAALLLAAPMLVGAGGARAAGPLILRAGTTQDLDSLNPYATALVVGYEAYELTYDFLVTFGPNLEPAPGFAESWQRAADGHSWSFKIRSGMKWADGQPATSADACFSFQLAIDAIKAGDVVGLGYIDPALADAGVTKAECPDATTMILTSDDSSQRILQTYIPILPKHIWGKETYKTMGDAKFDAPLIGTGPYMAVEWKSGQYIHFVRNPNYWGKKGAADEVFIVLYKTADSMVQAFKNGDLDYIRGATADQFNQLKTDPTITTVVGTSNGWTEFGFNAYGSGTGKTIKGGGPSTQALLDPAFRDAIGYAIDKQALLDRILGGYGTLGTTQVPPVLVQWHTDPATPRTFSIDTAKQKLDAAGYPTDASGQRMDKQGKPIKLRLYFPDSDDTYPDVAQFIHDWLAQLGIPVTAKKFGSGDLTSLMLPPEGGKPENKADYDLFIWSWSGNPDPNALLQIFTCDAIGSSSDSEYCNPQYDQLYADQNKATSPEARKAILDQMQTIFYNDAPYHILYYDSELHAYRTDKFGGWQKQPLEAGTPLFSYSTIGYSFLTDASVQPSPTAAASSGPAATGGGVATPAPSATPAKPASDSGSTPLIIGGILLIVVIAVGFMLLRRRPANVEDE